MNSYVILRVKMFRKYFVSPARFSSCDRRCSHHEHALQASMKYLHERLLVMLIAPPLPAIISNQHVDTTGSVCSDGKDGDEEYDAEESSTTTAESAVNCELVKNGFCAAATVTYYSCIPMSRGSFYHIIYVFPACGGG